MPQAYLIPLVDDQADFDETAGAPRLLLNMLPQGPPTSQRPRPVRTRPGITPWSGFPSTYGSTDPVVAMAMVEDSLVYVTDNGRGTRAVFSITNGIVSACSSAFDTFIDGTEQITLVAGRSAAIATGGGAPQRISAGISARLGGAPVQAVDATFLAQYLILVQKGRLGLFFWDSPGDSGIESWDLDFDFREAEARPDELIACDSTANELYMFGSSTTQLFLPDPDQVFAPGPVLENGILAKRSVIPYDRSMAWFESRKRFVLSDLRSLDVLSDQGIAETLERVESFDDVWGFRCKIGGHDLLVWSFPTEGRTFCWDAISRLWSEWRRWKNGNWQPWAPTSYLWVPGLGVHLVGLPDGRIAELSLDAHDDLGDSIRWEVVTGFHGGDGKRHCVEAQFPMRRGDSSDPSATVVVRWRDDLGAFCEPILLSLGTPGDYDTVGVVSPAGEPYRRRQWSVSGSAAEAYYVAPGKEIVEEVDF